MQNLNLIRQENFYSVQCDFYQGENDFYMTRQQIGEALEYKEPQKAIGKIHERHKVRLDKYSVFVSLTGTDGKLYDTVVYSRKGVFEICRWSRQPKADAFMDWTWDILDKLMSGRLILSEVKLDMRELYLDNVEELLEERESYVKERELKLLTAEIMIKEKIMKRCHLWLFQ